ncbi:SRPBCC family protein [Cryobacterium tepidiphilum]|uniref:SRPBCC family protein n=1 Tax=Cryobacterium tepidiphilum TaxID=2486026 RepID=UPI001314C7CF|nr:SRPBCC domain-containing protein [Cryobacterium tepidiphilum]
MTDRSFSLTRILDAPPSHVFRAWTDPARLGWFFNPHQPIPNDPIEVDPSVGGTWRQRMVVEDATVYTTGGIYREIVPDERLVFAWGAVDGWPELDPDDLDAGPNVTVTFTPVGEATRMTVTVTVADSVPDPFAQEWLARGIREGWSDTIDRLVDVV